ncbi:GNAT family N-acetyltransferase [Halobacillus halophilus]|uniref:GNAT family N-acetyltransferase n=1 Tax=Halobacillus halophilus TaxID=1570 RepID=UPI0013722911|nr:GNAT family N-acetyltransferase [Halobacillus halophilus]MYL29192.1 GNAT family N-acetyltransferase [Halobacillus halophilus]
MDENQGIIREAAAEDAPQLNVCMQKAYMAYEERMKGKRLPPMDVDYEEEIASYPVWVIEREGEIIGAVILTFDPSCTQVANIAVDPDYQGRGLGRKLLDFAEQKALDRGYVEMRLATHVLLTENAAFYTSMGWEEVGRDDSRVFFKKSLRIKGK